MAAAAIGRQKESVEAAIQTTRHSTIQKDPNKSKKPESALLKQRLRVFAITEMKTTKQYVYQRRIRLWAATRTTPKHKLSQTAGIPGILMLVNGFC